MKLAMKFWLNCFCTFSHKGFLSKYVKKLKEMKFLREDLIFSTHSEEVICFFFFLYCYQYNLIVDELYE